MFPVAEDRTIVECDWLYVPAAGESGADMTKSVELLHRVNEQDFEACERTQPAMASRVPEKWCAAAPPSTTSGSSTSGCSSG
jgi:glycine betaine catabolism A